MAKRRTVLVAFEQDDLDSPETFESEAAAREAFDEYISAVMNMANGFTPHYSATIVSSTIVNDEDEDNNLISI